MTVAKSEETRSPNITSGKDAWPSDALGNAPLRGELAHRPAETVKRARTEYILGHYWGVLRTLEPAARALTAAAQQAVGDASGRVQGIRSAASAWALLARAAERSGEPEVSARQPARPSCCSG
jgi:hypothetical protein